MKRHILLALVSLSAFSVMAQELRMPLVSNTIQEFIEENGTDMSKLIPSCPSFEACSHMNYHVKKYKMKGNAHDAFQKLLSLKPTEIWDDSSRFEMAYDPEIQQFIGKEHELSEVKLGQVFFLELDITKKMQIPVAFEVVEMNEETQTLSFSYLKQNKSNGIQRISFVQNGENFNIIHETRFQSESKFRDKFLYGIFHTKLLNDVWERFEQRL